MKLRPGAGTLPPRLARLVPGARARAERDQARARLVAARRRIRRLQGQLRRHQLREDLGYVFVVTYGRSGSTLLQGVLNSIPGYLIRGENRQVLTHLHDFHREALKERRSQRRQQRRHDRPVGGTTPADPFFGMDNFAIQASLRNTRRLAVETLLRPGPDTRVTGFKEIRWDDEEVAEYVAWLCEVFPGARFIVNTRDLEAVAQSKWWAEMPDAAERLAAVEQRLLDVAQSLGDAAYRVHYDDWAADPTALAPLFAWLGEEFDEARVRAVLEVPHSY